MTAGRPPDREDRIRRAGWWVNLVRLVEIENRLPFDSLGGRIAIQEHISHDSTSSNPTDDTWNDAPWTGARILLCFWYRSSVVRPLLPLWYRSSGPLPPVTECCRNYFDFILCMQPWRLRMRRAVGGSLPRLRSGVGLARLTPPL
jgi:hypothetical protein